jgi:predicted nucleic acid-binding Zn ribbon protein
LQPKGSCWYCDQPVDSVRRFCSSNCRDDYLEEEAEFGSEQ